MAGRKMGVGVGFTLDDYKEDWGLGVWEFVEYHIPLNTH